MLRFIPVAATLGIAGFDPLGVIALLAAMALGVSRRGVLVLTATTLVGTWLLGTVPALLLGPAVWRMHRFLHHVHHQVWGGLVIALGIGMLGWAVARLATRTRTREPKAEEAGRATPRSARPAALFSTGLLVALSALVDPAFYAGVVFAAQQRNPVATGAVMMIWVLFSQGALVVVGGAMLLGLNRQVEAVVLAVRTRWATPLRHAITAAIALFGLFCLTQGIAEWHGHWLHRH